MLVIYLPVCPLLLKSDVINEQYDKRLDTIKHFTSAKATDTTGICQDSYVTGLKGDPPMYVFTHPSYWIDCLLHSTHFGLLFFLFILSHNVFKSYFLK